MWVIEGQVSLLKLKVPRSCTFALTLRSDNNLKTTIGLQELNAARY